jgi:hypothetical protein
MKIHEITKRETDLICLYNDAKEANKQLAEAIQYAAVQAEASPAVVRRYIVALASEKANTVIAEAGQLMMLFDAMPTMQGQVAV